MKFYITTLVLLFPLLLEGQNFIDNHFPTYEDLERSTVVHISGKSFDLASVMIPDDANEEVNLQELVASVEALDVVAVDELENAKSEYNRGINILERSYSELMNYKEGEGKFSVFIDEQSEIVYEVVAIGVDETELMLVSITGEMELESIGQIINMINSSEVESQAPVKTITEITNFALYPNPIQGLESLSVEVPDAMMGGKGYVYNVNGAILNKFNLTDRQIKVNISSLQPGTYMVGLEKDNVQMKKRLIVVR